MSRYAMYEPRGKEIQLLLILTSVLDGGGQRHASAALYPRERTPGAHLIGGLVGLRAGLDTEARGKSFASAGDRTSVVQSVVRHYTD
jgi:hypothetical protein